MIGQSYDFFEVEIYPLKNNISMKKFLTFLSFLLPSIGLAQIDTSLALLIKDHTHDLMISKGGLVPGKSTSILQDAVIGSQFVLIGEQHGIVEVGQFSDRLYAMAQREGYRHLALEVSPFMAEELEKKVKMGKDSLMALDQHLPFSIPFYNNKNDFSMLANALDQEGNDYWGLDQVFIVEPRSLFGKLMDIAPNDEARALAKQYYEQGRMKINNAMKSGKFDEVILFQLTEEDYQALDKVFPTEENLLASEIIEHLRKTREIYQAWFDGRIYENNELRINLMKENFYRYYHSAVVGGEPLPKVLFKFGSNHMQRGLTSVNVFDLGNLAHELSLQNGMKSIHILFNGLKGESHNPLRGNQSFDQWEDLDPHFQFALTDKREAEPWLLVDLRPLRQERLKNVDSKLKNIIFGFDFWILVPVATPLQAF